MCHGTLCGVRRIILAQNTGFNKVIETVYLQGPGTLAVTIGFVPHRKKHVNSLPQDPFTILSNKLFGKYWFVNKENYSFSSISCQS